MVGDRVRIKVKSADLRLKQLDFDMVGSYDTKGVLWPVENATPSEPQGLYSKRGFRTRARR